MASPTYLSGLTTILLDFPDTVGWTAFGGGPPGMNAPETDYFIQGSNCISKNAFASATRGMIYDEGSGITVPTGEAVWAWLTHHTPGSIDPEVGAPGGMQFLIGSAAAAYNCWDIRGGDTLLYGADWICAVVDPTVSADDVEGSPGATLQFFGARWTLTGGPTKGAPNGIDAMRYGRDFTCTNGETDDYASFDGAAVWNDEITRRYGQFQLKDGVYLMQGAFIMGSSGTPVDFRDSDRLIFIRRNEKVASTFNEFEVVNASSNIEWENIFIAALGTVARGNFTTTDDAAVSIVACTFQDMGTFNFMSNAEVADCIFRRCMAITFTSAANLSESDVFNSQVAAGTSAVIWNLNSDPDTKMTGMSFLAGEDYANHAIEFGANIPSEITLREMDFEDYNASDGQSDSTLYFADTSGEITVNLIDCEGDISYDSAGCTVAWVIQPVPTTITVRDISDLGLIENARVLVYPSDAAGDMNYQTSVTSINRSGATATVVQTAHGLATNDKVYIEGANQPEYNGIHQITWISVNSYSYTVSGAPDTPATGTLLETDVLISGLTNASGIATATRSFSADQNITGRVREGTAPDPNYKTSPITGTVDKDIGFAATIFLVPD